MQQVVSQLTSLDERMKNIEAFGGEGITTYMTKLQAYMERKVAALEKDIEELKVSKGYEGKREILEYKAI